MNNMVAKLKIALAIPDDVEGMQEVFYRGWLATYPNVEHGITVDDVEDRYKDRRTDEWLAKVRQRIAHPAAGETTLVAKNDGKVVGVCRVVRGSDKNQLQAIYVLPDYHGCGIGTALWKAAQKHLDPTKHTIIEVATYNTKAIKFYEGLGFADTGNRMKNPKFTMKSGAVIPEIEMRHKAIA